MTIGYTLHVLKAEKPGPWGEKGTTTLKSRMELAGKGNPRKDNTAEGMTSALEDAAWDSPKHRLNNKWAESEYS